MCWDADERTETDQDIVEFKKSERAAFATTPRVEPTVSSQDKPDPRNKQTARPAARTA